MGDPEAFAVRCLDVLLNIAVGVDDDRFAGSCAPDQITRLCDGRLEESFDKHRVPCFNPESVRTPPPRRVRRRKSAAADAAASSDPRNLQQWCQSTRPPRTAGRMPRKVALDRHTRPGQMP